MRWPSRWPLQQLQPFQKKAQLQPPFHPSVDSLCHLWFAKTELSSYRFHILKLPPPPFEALLVCMQCMYVMFVCLLACLFVCLVACLLVCSFVCSFLRFFVRLCVCLLVCLLACLLACLLICLCVCLFDWLIDWLTDFSVCMYVSM